MLVLKAWYWPGCPTIGRYYSFVSQLVDLEQAILQKTDAQKTVRRPGPGHHQHSHHIVIVHLPGVERVGGGGAVI